MVAYDGTHYLGWQKTSMGPSIEESLEIAINQILQHPITLQAASRTDAGVHASGQVVNFFTEKPIKNLRQFQVGLNALLPSDITVMDVEIANENFHPTLDCIAKEYHYFICTGVGQLPFHRHFSWHYPYPLDVDSMREAARLLLGEHDFSAFCNEKKNSDYEHCVRCLYGIDILELPENRLQFKVKGNNFLYRMVRNLVGTLAYVGRGKIDKDAIPSILASKARPEAGITAPAHGLRLQHVFYHQDP